MKFILASAILSLAASQPEDSIARETADLASSLNPADLAAMEAEESNSKKALELAAARHKVHKAVAKVHAASTHKTNWHNGATSLNHFLGRGGGAAGEGGQFSTQWTTDLKNKHVNKPNTHLKALDQTSNDVDVSWYQAPAPELPSWGTSAAAQKPAPKPVSLSAESTKSYLEGLTPASLTEDVPELPDWGAKAAAPKAAAPKAKPMASLSAAQKNTYLDGVGLPVDTTDARLHESKNVYLKALGA